MDTSHFVVRGSLNKPNRQKKWVKYVFSSFLLETQSCTIKVYTCMHKILAMNPRPKMIWIKKPKGTRGGYDPIHLTSFSSYKGFENYCICAISSATLASTGATVQLFVIWVLSTSLTCSSTRFPPISKKRKRARMPISIACVAGV